MAEKLIRYGPYEDAASQAYLRDSTDRPTSIPGEVDTNKSLVSEIDQGTGIPEQVDRGIIPPMVDRKGF